MKRVLITGGLGYIGSHTAVLCIEAGYDVIIIDDLSNSKIGVLDAIEKLSGKRPVFQHGSILEKDLLKDVFNETKPDAVIHFAAYKSVNESVNQPIKYYKNNVVGSLNLFEVMTTQNVKSLIFSSSATVYREDQTVPFNENMERGSSHAYGQSKIIVESILETLTESINTISLRYFNPVGAHPSGLIGESPNDVPNNLFPIINQVAIGIRPSLSVFGTDYPTKDGSALRDFIHVMDVARAHVMALKKIYSLSGYVAINIGTGKPHSVLEVVNRYQEINNVKLKTKISSRRTGDIAVSYADVQKARDILGFSTKYSFEQMLTDSYQYIRNSQL